ncbi:sigma-70 family RNA polymerase sigma factor [Arenibaculum sp.]|uniref:sigma-70 family RNA polymerase sigma factor n=1 Tax=Arenibaculum sp. TaxID=2865862 RepID=UPI002E0D1F46|nr:sigma-70 family RNA polymerase sigma factor [Arenibaculum sp.]
MSNAPPTPPADGRARLLAVMADIRPELHRYCARLTGSVFDGEDIVHDVLVRALDAAGGLEAGTPLRPWLFRIAHNRALDHLRGQAVRRSEPMEAAAQVAEDQAMEPDEVLMRREAVEAAFSRFIELPTVQRSVVILKDVLGYSLTDISDLLDLSINAVKAALSRGRIRLRQINAASPTEPPPARPASAEASTFSSLFNRRDWDALRSLLAEDVLLTQATHADRTGRAEVGRFFTIYADIARVHLVPARLGGGEEVIAVFEQVGDEHPVYLMKVEWRDGRIARIRDFRYARYILEGADLVLAEAHRDGEAGRAETGRAETGTAT